MGHGFSVGVAEYIYGGGAHGEVEWSFKILDLDRARSNTLTEFLSPAEFEEICAQGIPRARAEFRRRLDDSRPSESSTPKLVTIAPRYSVPEGNLRLRCQFVGDVAYAFSDGNWDSYTTSVFIEIDFVPARLKAFVQLPAVLSHYWSKTGVPTGHYGWSLVGDGPFTREWLDALALDPRRQYEAQALVENILASIYTDKGKPHWTFALGEISSSSLWKADGQVLDEHLLRQCEAWVREGVAPLLGASGTVHARQRDSENIEFTVMLTPPTSIESLFALRSAVAIENTMNKSVVATQSESGRITLSFSHHVKPPANEE